MGRAEGNQGSQGAAWAALSLVCLVLVAPLGPVVAGRWLPIPDDGFASDLVQGEWPLRYAAGQRLGAQGTAAWSPDVGLGVTFWPDPWSALYAVLPPVSALGVHLAGLFVLAGGGSFLLARQHGASPPAAALAAFGFAWSGYLASHVRHLAILGVICWFPLALYFLERLAGGSGQDRGPPASRAEQIRCALAFGFVWGMQALGGFPQSALYCAIVYAGLTLSRMVGWRASPRIALGIGVSVLLATCVGAGLGAPGLLPLAETASLSDRAAGIDWEDVYRCRFWAPNVLGFVVPYPFGDVSNGTYWGGNIFSEDHGYVGMVTGLLAAGFGIRGGTRKFVGAFWAITGLLALLMVLGPATPLFRLVFEYVPGMHSFRFPTRYLFVVELAFAQAAAHGLDQLIGKSGGMGWPAGRKWAITALCALDLFWFNHRQVPIVEAAQWLDARTPEILANRPPGRLYPREMMALHGDAFVAARGWADTTPYLALQPGLQPNSNLIFGVPTVTGYLPIAGRGVVDLVGDHNRRGLLQQLDGEPARLAQLLDLLDVRYVTTVPGWPVTGTLSVTRVGELALVEREGSARVRVVRDAIALPDAEAVLAEIRADHLDLRRTAVFSPDTEIPHLVGGVSSARLVLDAGDRLEVDVDGDGTGVLVVADWAHPAWTAEIDGVAAPLHVVDLALRGVVVPAGPHRVVLRWRPAVERTSLLVAGASLIGGLLAALLATLTRPRRSRCMATADPASRVGPPSATREAVAPLPLAGPDRGALRFALRTGVDLQLRTCLLFLRPELARVRGTVLDVGAGLSPWRSFLRPDVHYTGIDVSLAKDFGLPDQPDVTYYPGPDFPVRDQSVDAVLCVEVLEHVPVPQHLIGEMYRVLRPDGRLILTVPWSARRHYLPHDYHRFTPDALRNLLGDAGFRDIVVRERGNGIAVVANKLVILALDLLRPRASVALLWRFPVGVACASLVPFFLGLAHLTLTSGHGVPDDPLGYGVTARKPI